MDTEICEPDKQYMTLGKNERRDATPTNRPGSVDDTLSGRLPNVQRKGNHEICESYPDARGSVPQAERLPTEEPDNTIICHPYLQTDCQAVIVNIITLGKVLRNPTRPEPLQTVPTPEQ